VGGVEEDLVEAGVDGVAEVGAVGFELGGEGGELLPGVEGGAVDADHRGDGGGGLAGGEEGERGELAGGELGVGRGG
jgi:hypothetical protein